MRTIGVLGGITWHSAAEYYRLLNTLANERAGGIHAARCVLFSVDVGEIDPLLHARRWDDAGRMLAADAKAVEAAGAEVFALACNTLHHVWDAIVADLQIPAIHIGDAVADALARDGRERVALVGTSYTMTLPFLRERIAARGIEVVVPGESSHARIDRTIFDEFGHGVFSDETRRFYVDLIGGLGGDAVVFGCTELGLLLTPDDVAGTVYDTARVHAEAVVDYATNVV
ncbi:MAG TPA: amino acid racemase [Gaiellaceae bacterium]|nr:amino acid racemase [Gaiellaceae bacterium]